MTGPLDTPQMRAFAAEIEAWKAGGNNLEVYWKEGPGAAKVGWGTPGSMTRCHRHLNKHVGSERAWRICAQWFHDVTGMWPSEREGDNPAGPG